MDREEKRQKHTPTPQSMCQFAANAKCEDHMLYRELDEAATGGRGPCKVFGMFDGHNGFEVAQWASENLISSLVKNQFNLELTIRDMDAGILALQCERARLDKLDAYNLSIQGTTAAIAIVDGKGVTTAVLVRKMVCINRRYSSFHDFV
jgi:serine/threonine protein phosphatase PrpC